MLSQKKERTKNVIAIVGIILICVLYSERDKIFGTSAKTHIDPAAEKAALEEVNCIQNSISESFQASEQLTNEEMELQKEGKSAVDVYIAQRRLEEAHCIKEAACGLISSNKQHNQMMFDMTFSSCLDDYSNPSNGDELDPPEN